MPEASNTPAMPEANTNIAMREPWASLKTIKLTYHKSKRKSEIYDVTSSEGRQLLQEVQKSGEYFQPVLHRIFCKQRGLSNCGVNAIALVMSAACGGRRREKVTHHTPQQETVVTSKDHHTHHVPYTEQSLFTYAQTIDTLGRESDVRGRGISLQQMTDCLNKHYPGSTTLHHAGDVGIDGFRRLACEALRHKDSGAAVIINFHRPTMGQGDQWYGHHTPLGGYHPATDRFLVVDVCPFREDFWATTEDLFIGMNTVDGGTKRQRGFCVFRPKFV